jgi:hypothetical protein
LFGTIITLLLLSRERHWSLVIARVGRRYELPVPLNAAVMRRFERVVALPDPKIVFYPAESTAWKLQRVPGSYRRGRTFHHLPNLKKASKN